MESIQIRREVQDAEGNDEQGNDEHGVRSCYWCGSTSDMKDRNYFCSAGCGYEYAIDQLDVNGVYWCEDCGRWVQHEDHSGSCKGYGIPFSQDQRLETL